MSEERPKRGFARLTPAERSAISKKGNRRLRQLGLVHQFDSEEAKAAAAKGGFGAMWKKRRQADSEDSK